MLFSEPKIPQSCQLSDRGLALPRFSALQRAENSSMLREFFVPDIVERFSALQRAENSSMPHYPTVIYRIDGFSALQRAENSSIRSRHTVRP